MNKDDIFKYKKLNYGKILNYGFVQSNDVYIYKAFILNGEFQLIIKIKAPNKIFADVIETQTNEPYTLHLTNETGNFIGQVRKEYENILIDISNRCFDADIFKSKQAKDIIRYISEKYDNELEFLWEKSPDCAIARRHDNKKWYLVIMTVKKDRLGFDSADEIEIIDLRAQTDDIPLLLKSRKIYPGYHMNKKHWITIVLDDSLPVMEIYKLLDESYELANKKGKK